MVSAVLPELERPDSEEVVIPFKKLPPLTVVDFRVAVYHLFAHYNSIADNHSPSTANSWLKAAWGVLLNRGFTGLPYFDHQVVVVDDCPPYWRSTYLSLKGFPEYKANRPAKEERWYQVQRVGLDYITSPNSPLHYLVFPTYEADDIAAAICRLQPNRTIVLHTIDSDWLGLVDDGSRPDIPLNILETQKYIGRRVVWGNMAHWSPRLRGNSETIAYVAKRLKASITRPEGIWSVKQVQGDKSDNLVAGSPIEVINLKTPPPQHDLLETEARQNLEDIVHADVTNSNIEHLKASQAWFEKSGFPIPLVNYYQYPVFTKFKNGDRV